MGDSAVDRRLGEVPWAVSFAVQTAFRSIALAHRLRYRRLKLQGDVYIRGRLRIAQGTSVTIGAGTRISRGVRINGGGHAKIGEDCLLNGCWIGARSEVIIGDRSLISDCDITDSDFHNLSPAERHLPPTERATRPIHVGRNVWIGAKAIVLKGSVIGDDSVIGAGAVVRGTIPARVLVTGNPARVERRL